MTATTTIRVLEMQAAPFVGACGPAVATGSCNPSCADALLPFNLECFQGVLRQPFFAYAPQAALPSNAQLAAVYAACFPPWLAPTPAPAPAEAFTAAFEAVGAQAAPWLDAVALSQPWR